MRERTITYGNAAQVYIDTASAPGPQSGAPPAPGAALVFLLLYIFLDLSRAHEMLFPIPRLMLLLGALTLLTAMVTTGGILAIYSRIPVLFLLWFLIACLSALFGMYRTGSVEALQGWLPNAIIAFAGIHVLSSPARCRAVLYTMAAAAVFLVAASRLGSSDQAGRLGIASSTIGNANDYAATMVFLTPGILLMVMRGRGPVRWISAGLLATVPALVVRTGSRGGMVGLAVVALAAIWPLPAIKKLGLAVLLGAVGLAGFLTAPEAARGRMAVLTEGGEGGGAEAGAAESGALRRELLIGSIYTTLRHPLLGVGVGNNMLGTNEEAVRKGFRPTWRVSHNTYTQVSSELGIPGFVVYVMLLITCVKRLGRGIRLARTRPEWKDVLQTAVCARLALISFCTTSMFLTHAYSFFVPVAAILAHGVGEWADRVPPKGAGGGLV